ncbi:hypothetical protein BpHYR1_013099 [Brachionus plicatilis]|uniref:Uncharacterized protein n=1 Tax=Brachionus plicatilis TaxID=10195 RepID=A0A3M7P9B3_BRAPC|nr:hypothetical protein BpHYR1_013099 [Brachionus plicatilis]
MADSDRSISLDGAWMSRRKCIQIKQKNLNEKFYLIQVLPRLEFQFLIRDKIDYEDSFEKN